MNKAITNKATMAILALLVAVCARGSDGFDGGDTIPAGYGKLKWGASPSEIKTHFPTVVGSREKDPDFPSAKIGVVKYKSGSVTERQFVVKNNRLVKVLVYYNTDGVSIEALIKKFVNKFGPSDDVQEEQDLVDGVRIDRVTALWIGDKTTVALRYVSAGFSAQVLAAYVSADAADQKSSEAAENIEF